MPRKSNLMTRAVDETHEEHFFRLTESRRENTAASAEYIEQPKLFKNIAPSQGARKDTALPQPSPKARPTESFEDEVEF